MLDHAIEQMQLFLQRSLSSRGQVAREIHNHGAKPARDLKRSFEWAGNCASDPCQITGATVEAEFDAAPLTHAMRPVVVEWNRIRLAQITIDFRSLE